MRFRLPTLLTQFTIRDLLWFMVMVGIEGAWLVDRNNMRNEQALADQKCYEIKGRLLAEIKTLQEANKELEYREAARETKERIRKIQSGELPYPPHL